MSFFYGFLTGISVGAVGIALVIHNNQARFLKLAADVEALRKALGK